MWLTCYTILTVQNNVNKYSCYCLICENTILSAVISFG